MQGQILFNTEKENTYCFDRNKGACFLIHPSLKKILLEDSKININEEPICNDQLHPFNKGIAKSNLTYYKIKFDYLKKHGYFKPYIPQQNYNKRLSGQDIKSALANTDQLTFEVTEKCNLNCKYCGYGKFYNDYGVREKNELSFKMAKNLIDYLFNLWNSSLNKSKNKQIFVSFYGGEPLLNMNLIKQIVKYIENSTSRSNVFRYNMTTNGIMLNKHMDYLVQKEFRLLISLDGNEENNQYRVFNNGRGTFSAVLRNVYEIQSKYPEYFENNVNFNAVLHNKNSISEIYNFYKDTFSVLPRIGELNTSGILESLRETFWNTYSNAAESLFEAKDRDQIEEDMFINLSSIQSLHRFINKHSGSHFQDYNELLFGVDNSNMLPTGTCIPFSKKIYVTANGKILPCETVGHQFSLGFVNDTCVSIDLMKIADNQNEYYQKLVDQCAKCYQNNSCPQCMFNFNIAAKKPKCDAILNKSNFQKRLIHYLKEIEAKPKIYSKLVKEVLNA